MVDLIVTTPRSESAKSAQEARDCIASGGGHYFRRLSRCPHKTMIGDRLYYVEADWITGFGIITGFTTGEMLCGTTGRFWREGLYVLVASDTWSWIKPVSYKSFRGWRYFDRTHDATEIVGDWLDPRPPTPQAVHA